MMFLGGRLAGARSGLINRKFLAGHWGPIPPPSSQIIPLLASILLHLLNGKLPYFECTVVGLDLRNGATAGAWQETADRSAHRPIIVRDTKILWLRHGR